MQNPDDSTRRQAGFATTLQGILGRVLRINPQDIDVEAPFLELGADSLALVEALRGLQESFGVKMTIRQLFEQYPSIAALAAFLDATLPAGAAAPAAPVAQEGAACPLPAPAPARPTVPAQAAPAPAPVRLAPRSMAPLAPLAPAAPLTATGSGMERVLGMQIQAFTNLVSQQLQVLSGTRWAAPDAFVPEAVVPDAAPAAPAPALVPASAVPAPAAPAPANPAAAPVLPTWHGKGRTGGALNERQQQHLQALIERYTRRTAKSKALTQKYRPFLADSRAAVGFRASIKEMVYPLARARAQGSRLWDVDGNEYIDLTMGMGVHLFGHQPDWLQESLERQVREGFELGPRSEVSGEVAALFCELTGNERATFTNSGTEAVMTAIRLARARTGRTRIVMFAGSYHGHSDGTLAQTQEVDGELHSFPVAPGIPGKVAEEVLVLDYGAPESLDIIRKHAGELAAVLVEPVQSRRPQLQPREFLHELRRLTAEHGIALIFDEMICGFRLHLGGAQAWYGIRADLATYGKIVGGGVPIGVVAGKADYMDGIDGGMWQYGDDSAPSRETTFFGGTFCQHPLAMGAAKRVLEYLKQQGPGLQETLNARTGAFTDRLNRWFEDDAVPIRMAQCSSFFRFNFSANADLLFFHMVERGVYVWEWRNCFLSTAHTDADLDTLVGVVQESVGELRRGGLLPEGPGGGGGSRAGREETAPAPPAAPAPAAVGATPLGFWDRQGKPAITSAGADRPAAPLKIEVPADAPPPDPDREMWFSLYYFGAYDSEFRSDKYDLIFDSARFADRHGFSALWFPERHFHRFGGISPNPSVLAAALARETERIALRAGSVVLPLHHPVRVAEEWAVVDNLSGGRVGISYASGWHPNDFALKPESYGRHRDLMFEQIETVNRLWRGEAVRMKDGAGKEVDLRIYPAPARRDLPAWITIVNNPDTYRRAGEMGAGVLTNLMGQTPESLAESLAIYRAALARAGHPQEAGHVTLLLHTFVAEDAEHAVETARRPFYEYLKSSVGLLKNMIASEATHVDLDNLSEEDLEYMLELAYGRYVRTSALIGSPETCAPIVERLRDAGVDEIACLIDFGVAPEAVRDSLPWLDRLKEKTRFRSRMTPEAPSSLTTEPAPLLTSPLSQPPPAQGGGTQPPAELDDRRRQLSSRRSQLSPDRRALLRKWVEKGGDAEPGAAADTGSEEGLESPLVPIRPQGAKPPVFLIHPVSGHVHGYLRLAGHLDPEIPVYGLQSVGVLGGEPLRTMAEMAERYLAAMRTVTRGPYYLGGWSTGGVVGLEMSRRILAEEEGGGMGALFLLDSHAPPEEDENIGADEAALLAAYAQDFGPEISRRLDDATDQLREVASEERLDWVLNLLRTTGAVPESFDGAQLHRHWAVLKANVRAFELHRITPGVAVPTVLFRCTEQPEPADTWPLLGWERFITCPLEVVAVPGDHHGVVREPGVRIVAKGISARITADVAKGRRAGG